MYSVRSADTAWFLERVVVKESDAALIEHVFACNAWIEPDTPGEPARAVLTSSCAQLATPLPDAERALLRHEGLQPSSGDWVVWTYTGEHHEAPTDTLVSLLLGGTERQSQPLPLKYQVNHRPQLTYMLLCYFRRALM